MASFNKSILMGRLGQDPFINRNDKNEVTVVSASLATEESFYENGEKKKKTDWHKVVFFGKLAAIAEKYLKKGSFICVEGKLKNTDYTDKEGIKHYVSQVQVDRLEMISSIKKEELMDVPF